MPGVWAEQAARRLMERIDVLAGMSEEPGMLVRRSYTPALRAANDAVAGWMRAAGMAVREDAASNLVGRYEGTDPSAGAFLLGSHLDSVRDAGRFDGPLGILVALACIARLHENGSRLPCALELIAFSDEEGLRFTSYLGSSAIAGSFDPAWLEQRDADGISLAEAIRDFGGDPGALVSCRKDPREVRGYCEVHIEQGPVLEGEDLPVGVVRAIAGQSRLAVTFSGSAGHAGTVPMTLRRDALCAAAEWVLAVERVASRRDGIVATIGQIDAAPGASNVIPGRVRMSLDVRHQDDAEREAALVAIRDEGEAIVAKRGIRIEWHPGQSSAAVPCSPALGDRLARAIEQQGYTVHWLTSGAGHDAVPLSALTEVAMLFVRCRGGISHHPDESVTVRDVEVAIEVLYSFLQGFAA